ncbi:hypothetical protein HMPREF3136_00140 [Neisseria sp. HMSC15C08]|jgi:hypothetical protein|uniref:hypothetical protein n=1 Tax=Neisseria TaxID=482 RepID=UPI0008A3F5DD|nr:MULTISPECIES: hypothetical protein [Neisseria]OFV46510.1 hypothetical protein HMPREF3136_00140 [Neisseria sp. HMSC15C08]
MEYFLYYSNFLFKIMLAIFFACVLLYIYLTTQIRKELSNILGYSPAIKSKVLWESVKEESKSNKNMKATISYFIGIFMRFVFVSMWILALLQMVKNDIK